MAEQHPRFVPIEFFINEMLGYKSRSSYYNHEKDEGWPQRVYPGGKPMLVYAECVAYMEQLMGHRAPPPPFHKPPPKKPPEEGRKRRPGRPVKPPSGSAAPAP